LQRGLVNPFKLLLLHVLPRCINRGHFAFIHGLSVRFSQFDQHRATDCFAFKHFWLNFFQNLLPQIVYLLIELRPELLTADAA